jgi:hypothetical protein
MPEVQPAPGMRKRFLTTVFVMAAVLAKMLARIWSDLRCAPRCSATVWRSVQTGHQIRREVSFGKHPSHIGNA